MNPQTCLAVEPERAVDARIVATDEFRPIIERAEALGSWIADDNDDAARFVVEQLKTGRTNTEWYVTLVFATETINFSQCNLQSEATVALHRAALDLRAERTAGIERAVYCAIARYASLVDPADADQFRALLDPGGYVDTRLAALKAIVHLFEMAPPEQVEQHATLRDRIVELAHKFLDPDVFVSGQNSAIAKEAIVAAAALGDVRLPDLMGLAVQVERDWFRRELSRRLDELRNLWTENGVEEASAPFRRLESVIDLVER